VVRPVAAELVRVGPDARQRRLEVVADAAKEVVLDGIQLEELGVLGLDHGEELGVPDRDRDLAGEQLEEVLVAALPRSRGRQVAHEHADLLAANPKNRADGARIPRDVLLDRNGSRIHELDLRVDHLERGLGMRGGPPDEPVHAIPGRGCLDGREDLPELPVPALEVTRQAVVALGEPGHLVVAGNEDLRGQVAGRDAVDGRGDGPKRARQVGGQQVRDEDADERRDDDREQQESAGRRVRSGAHDGAGRKQEDPEARERQDRGGHEPEREARAE
jgi:hypothetical protein